MEINKLGKKKSPQSNLCSLCHGIYTVISQLLLANESTIFVTLKSGLFFGSHLPI